MNWRTDEAELYGSAPIDDGEQAQAELEQQQAITEILDALDRGERLTSAQMLLLRWFCGVPAPNPPEEQASIDWQQGAPF